MSDVTIDVLDTIAAVQEGDHETISTVLSAKIISPNAKDANGCTLLHWAAINNRITVAKLLIEYGANSSGGGMLDESPLHWCLRKRYYRMAKLLVEKLHVDLRHKSAQGLDVLHLCCRLKDLHGVFLILSWGANPNSIDDDGNTPLLWLAKYGKISTDGDIFRLLVRFGARVDIFDPVTRDGIFHIFAKNEIHDLGLLFALYQPGRTLIPFMVNSGGITPYSQSILSENRILAGFLFDVLIFNSFPYWTPAFITMAFIPVLLAVLHYSGYISCAISAAASSIALYYLAWQPRIVEHFSRVYVGLFYGLLGSIILHFFWMQRPLLSVLASGLALTLVCSLLYLAYTITVSKPAVAPMTSVKELADRIADSAPSEGTDEENEFCAKSEWMNGHVKVIKDSFTGKIQTINVHDLDSTRLQRGRIPGPAICCSCLCDREFSPDFESTDELLGCSGEESASALLASFHCGFCNTCVVAVDHHSQILGVCIGIGNRRRFVFFLCLGIFSSIFYIACVKWIQYSIVCPSQSRWLIDSEWCLFQTERVSTLFQWLSFIYFVWCCYTLFLEVQALSIGNVFANAAPSIMQLPPFRRRLHNIIRFFRTGSYVVLPHLRGSLADNRTLSRHNSQDFRHRDCDSCNHSLSSRSVDEREDIDSEHGPLSLSFEPSRNRR